MPHDWQRGAIIEALDMEGRWYRAKVLHVAEHAAMVKYLNWPDKWNEWIDRSSDRLRALSSAGGPGRDDGARGETHDDLCAVCEEAGSLVCCDGPCRRAFHVECVPANNAPPSGDGALRRWRCADCISRRFRCFACKGWGAARDEVVCCPRKTCGKHYHAECLLATTLRFGETCH